MGQHCEQASFDLSYVAGHFPRNVDRKWSQFHWIAHHSLHLSLEPTCVSTHALLVFCSKEYTIWICCLSVGESRNVHLKTCVFLSDDPEKFSQDFITQYLFRSIFPPNDDRFAEFVFRTGQSKRFTSNASMAQMRASRIVLERILLYSSYTQITNTYTHFDFSNP